MGRKLTGKATGRVTLRMPKELHQRLINVAISMNVELTSLANLMLTEELAAWERKVRRVRKEVGGVGEEVKKLKG
ncbi:MAG TPA: hypothetical protein VEA69_00175 [Tepidisphaeraceae bacterium]|nr:hypothetical protein [Tepidisphaeraceae bacterium]